MLDVHFRSSFARYFLFSVLLVLISSSYPRAEDSVKNQEPPPVPVRVAVVEKKMVSDQISLVGTAEAIAMSTVAAEVSGVVESFPVKEGDFVKKGDLLVRLRSINLELRLKGTIAEKGQIAANLQNAEKELSRVSKLKDSKSIAETKYDFALFTHRALAKKLQQKDAEIEQLEYEIKQKKVVSPFSGFVAKEHTQVGEWVSSGGAVVTLLDLGQIQITVDLPERYAVLLRPDSEAKVVIRSISNDVLIGKIYAIIPHGDPDSRTFPVKVNLANPGFKIKSGMEAYVTFDLEAKKNALLIPKDAVVTAGNNRLVFYVADGKALPVNVRILGYYDGDVAVEGDLTPGKQVVIRGNERLRPGQPVSVVE
jgi:RND family efflux transporter MFP subunit